MNKKRLEKLLTGFYDAEVFSRVIPPLPGNIESSPAGSCEGIKHSNIHSFDRLLLTAIIAASLILISIPGVYDNPLRRSVIHINQIEAIKERIPELFYETSMQYKFSKGV